MLIYQLTRVCNFLSRNQVSLAETPVFLKTRGKCQPEAKQVVACEAEAKIQQLDLDGHLSF